MDAAPEIATRSYRIGRWCAAALLVTADGRYLMQHRDDKPGILLPGHWALFGGAVDPGEPGDEAIRRELEEELEFRPANVAYFTEFTVGLPLAQPRFDRMSFYAVAVTDAEIAAMVQHEGQGKRLFTAEALAAEPRVSPWDLAAVLMHARQAALFDAKDET
jgi:8-oxo-dGTP pyrophosphatase MutT (NUDIX family)